MAGNRQYLPTSIHPSTWLRANGICEDALLSDCVEPVAVEDAYFPFAPGLSNIPFVPS